MCTVFDSISFNIDEVRLINPSANVLSLETLTCIILDWLTYSGGTDRSGELCYNCDFHSPALLDFFLSSDASICYAMAFPPLRNPDHVVVLVSIDFPSNSQRDALFHRIAYDYSRADWDGLRDHLRDVLWEDIFKLLVLLLLLVNFVRGFRLELIYIYPS